MAEGRRSAASPRRCAPSRSAIPSRWAISAVSISEPGSSVVVGAGDPPIPARIAALPFVLARPEKSPVTENRLARETSPYLLQHAHNPVDWYPWGEEAFERARREDRPLLLSVGYSACHWCHVMERESFENPAIAGAHERALRQREGGPRGAARRGPDLHAGGPGA